MTKKGKRNRSTSKISVNPGIETQNRSYIWLTGIEDLLIVSIVAVALLLFVPSLPSTFTLPKLAAFSVLAGLLALTFMFRISTGAFHALPRLLWIPLLALILWWFISTTQAISPLAALEGQYGRYNGLYTNVLLTGMFFIVASIPMNQKRVKRLSIFLMVLIFPVLWYAIIQHLGLDPVFKGGFGSRPGASIGNPVSLATILLLVFPFLLVETLRADRYQEKIPFSILLFVLVIVTLMTGSRGPWLGFIVCLGSMILLLLLDQKAGRHVLNKRILLPVGVAVVIAVLFLAFSPVSERLKLGHSFSARIFYFSVALEAIKDSPLFGYGFESFRLIYPAYRPEIDIKFFKDTTPTMIHNDYLQLVLDNGFFSLVFYLTFMGAVMWLMFKQIQSGEKAQRTLVIAMFAMLTGYLVAGLSIWPEAGSLIIFWMILSICVAYLISSQTVGASGRAIRLIYLAFTSVYLAVAISYSVLMVGNIQLDYLFRKALANSKSNYTATDQYIYRMEPDIVDSYHYQNRVGLIYTERLLRKSDDSTYKLARKHLLRASELNPFDAYVRIQLVETDMISLQRKLIPSPSMEAQNAMQEALRIDPNNPTVYRVAATFASLQGDANLARRYRARMNEINSLK